MLENSLAKGTEIDGATAQMFFTEDTPGTQAEVQGTAVDFSLNGNAGVFLPYRPNGINYVVPQGRDVISSRFTGCYMVKYTVAGTTRIAHVATPECKDAWAALKGQPGVTVQAEFKPTDHIDVANLITGTTKGSKGEVLGIITATGYCIAIAAFRTGSGNDGSTKLLIHSLTLVKA